MRSNGRKLFVLGVLGAIAIGLGAVARGAGPSESEKIRFFESKVRPILESSCFKCHGGETKIKGGLRLTSRETMLRGGDTGPAVSLEQPSQSLLLKAISYKDEDLQMPPKERLSAE